MGPYRFWLIALGCLMSAPGFAQSGGIGFQSCAAREAKAGMDSAIRRQGEIALYGYHSDIVKLVLNACSASERPSPQEMQQAAEAVESHAKKLTEAQIKRELQEDQLKELADAPRANAVRQAQEKARSDYYRCLVQAARVLAVNSAETADLIAKASFAACIDERLTMLNVPGRTWEVTTEGMANVMDGRFYQALLLEVIGARALRSTERTSSPAVADDAAALRRAR